MCLIWQTTTSSSKIQVKVQWQFGTEISHLKIKGCKMEGQQIASPKQNFLCPNHHDHVKWTLSFIHRLQIGLETGRWCITQLAFLSATMCLPSNAWNRRLLKIRMTFSMAERSGRSWGLLSRPWYSSSNSRARCASEFTMRNKQCKTLIMHGNSRDFFLCISL